jgi:hypothetical protein
MLAANGDFGRFAAIHAALSARFYARRLSHGAPPPYRTLVTDKDVENLAAYIDWLGGRKEPTFNLWRKKRPQR